MKKRKGINRRLLKPQLQTPEELPECPDHRPTSFLKGKPRSILSLQVFYNILLESFMIDALGYKSTVRLNGHLAHLHTV